MIQWTVLENSPSSAVILFINCDWLFRNKLYFNKNKFNHGDDRKNNMTKKIENRLINLLYLVNNFVFVNYSSTSLDFFRKAGTYLGVYM